MRREITVAAAQSTLRVLDLDAMMVAIMTQLSRPAPAGRIAQLSALLMIIVAKRDDRMTLRDLLDYAPTSLFSNHASVALRLERLLRLASAEWALAITHRAPTRPRATWLQR